MREAFENHLKILQNDLIDMSEMVITSIKKSVTALKDRDVEFAKKIRKEDYYINKKRWEIEEKCIHLIATQQPVAVHLREIIAVLNIITDLERMGDYAEGIAKAVIKMNGEPLIKPLIDIPRMRDISIEMIDEAIDAFSNRDEQAARLVNAKDDEVDMLYHQVNRELISIMIENPRTITQCTYLMWVSHNLERIADRVTNICERIIFLVTGEMEENIKN